MTMQEKFEFLYNKFVEEHPDVKCTGYYADSSTPMSMLVHAELGDIGLKLDLINMEYKVTTSDVSYIKDETPVKPHKPHGGFSGFIGFLLTAFYAWILLTYFGSQNTLGGYIAYQMVRPHVICVVVSAVLSIVGCIGKVRWAMLVSAVLMIVAGILMPSYIIYVVIQPVFFFISYARMK